MPPSRRLWLANRLYFAGHSRQWEGGVAFLELEPSDDHRATRATAHLLAGGRFDRVVMRENGLTGPVPWRLRPAALSPGTWTSLPVALSPDGTGGKYDAVLRLPDLDGRPAVTLTTSRALPRRAPGADYLRVIRLGLAGDPELPDPDAYLARARGA